jgi:hypothetical protein
MDSEKQIRRENKIIQHFSGRNSFPRIPHVITGQKINKAGVGIPRPFT